MKTAESTDDKPTPPPSDRDVVKAFIAEAAELKERAKTAEGDREYHALINAAEARLVLADRLQATRDQRVAYIKQATDRFAKSMAEAGEKVAEAMNSWYRKSEEHEARDQK